MAPQSRSDTLGLSVPGGQRSPLPSARPRYSLICGAMLFSVEAFPHQEGTQSPKYGRERGTGQVHPTQLSVLRWGVGTAVRVQVTVL